MSAVRDRKVISKTGRDFTCEAILRSYLPFRQLAALLVVVVAFGCSGFLLFYLCRICMSCLRSLNDELF